ncbi:CAP domain-containing protein [Blautia sp.]|uniref:CAP domain-containing protein n=1 Tax=Blautia sp. TaxID=1955243 RepID=UPI003AB3BA8E
MIEKPNKTRLRNGLLVVLLAITLIAPAVFQGPVQAASKRTPTRPVITKVTATKNSATVTWKKSKYATSYRIYYKQAGAKKWTTLATISSKKLKYTHKSSRKYPLKGGKKYTYTVRAYNKYGRKWSSYDTKGKTVTIPAVPSIVKTRVKANNYKQTTVTWTKSINATNYLVYYRSADTTKWTRIANVSSKTLKYVHKSSRKYPVEAGRTYYYMVRGYNKTFKTYGGYSKTGTRVAIPERPAATPTATPTVAPTATPKPTQKPKPTATPKPTVTPKPTQKPKPTATPTPDPDSPSEINKKIKKVVKLTNQVRVKHGSAAVVEDAALDAGAAVRAKEIYTKFSHGRPDGSDFSTAYYEAGAGNILGENIATGDTPERAVYLWENSRGHLVSMLDREATHIGVGVYKNFWVQIFAKNPGQKYTLTVYANGGTFPSKGGVEKFEMSVPARADIKLSTIDIPEKEGSSFMGWTECYENPYFEGGLMDLDYIKNNDLHMPESKTLKANWADTSDSSSN